MTLDDDDGGDDDATDVVIFEISFIYALTIKKKVLPIEVEFI